MVQPRSADEMRSAYEGHVRSGPVESAGRIVTFSSQIEHRRIGRGEMENARVS